MSTRFPDNHLNNPIGDPYRWGYCDYVMRREPDCPWKGLGTFVKQQQYLKGYLTAQGTGVQIGEDLHQLMKEGK